MSTSLKPPNSSSRSDLSSPALTPFHTVPPTLLIAPSSTSFATRAQPTRRFEAVHSAVYNLFNLARHCVSAPTYRSLRQRAFGHWQEAV